MAQPPQDDPAKKHGSINKGVVFILLAALVPLAMGSVILLFFTMLPTLGAWAGEKHREKYAWLCVGGFNFAGVVHYLINLWFGNHTAEGAFSMLSEATVLVWAYGSAGVGWMFYLFIPPMITSWVNFVTGRKTSGLRAAQKKLATEWGDEVMEKE